MLKGSCCCKKVKFEINEHPVVMGTCHCTRCRKVGASTILLIKKTSLTITSGKEFIATYFPEDSYKYKRNFCNNCGTALGEIVMCLLEKHEMILRKRSGLEYGR